jgi:hypothetical protein
MATIKVTARAGRTVPIHKSIATAPGATQLYLRNGEELEVDESNALVQRMLRPGGDLVRVDAIEPKVAEPLPARVDPEPFPPATSKES